MEFDGLEKWASLLAGAQAQRRGDCQQSVRRVKPILLIWYPQIIHNTRCSVLSRVATK
jgi:hypothetical protein